MIGFPLEPSRNTKPFGGMRLPFVALRYCALRNPGLPRARGRSMRTSILCAAMLLIAPAFAEEQSWSKRTPPPVKYAPPPPEQKEHDWSGFHMGVNAGSGFGTNNRDSASPGSSNIPR
jgi:hypothetical protein